VLTLIVGHYVEPVAARRKEIASTLWANIKNPAFDRVIVVVEDQLWTEAAEGQTGLGVDPDERFNFVFLGRRLTYADAFGIANAPHWARGAFVLANSDIEFDRSVELAEEVPEGALWCVTRTEANGEHPWKPDDSQDAWIFRPPLKPFTSGFKLGVPGCDNRIAFEAKRAGLVLGNPGRRIRALHNHASAVRRVVSQYRGPALGVPLDPA
jgi:hypothetical protein